MDDPSFLSVYESAPVAILIVDGDVRIKSTNRSARELLSKPLDDVLGVRAGEVFGCLNRFDDPRGCGKGPECGECKIRGSVTRTLATSEPVRRVEATMPVSVGERQALVSLLVSTAPISWDGKPHALLCLENITDLKAVQEQLRRSNEHMRVLNSILRHDIRGNLGIVSASIELAEQETGPAIDPKARERLDKAVAVIHRSADLLDHMKDLEKAISPEQSLRVLDLRAVVDSVKGNSELNVDVRGDGKALADDALSSAVDNIINNADHHGRATRVDIDISQDEGWNVMRIADDGMGIPDDIKGKVFDRGFTTGGENHLGLGLYIAKAVVEMYGGSIRVEDNMPRGAVFVIELRKPKRTETR